MEGPDDGILIERRLLTTTEDRVKVLERVQQVTVATPVTKRFVVETRYVGERAGPPRSREGAITERIVREDAPADLAAGKPELRLETGRFEERGGVVGGGGVGVGGGGGGGGGVLGRRRTPSPTRGGGTMLGGRRSPSPTRGGGGGGGGLLGRRRSPSPTRATAPRGATLGGTPGARKTVDVPQGPPLTTEP